MTHKERWLEVMEILVYQMSSMFRDLERGPDFSANYSLHLCERLLQHTSEVIAAVGRTPLGGWQSHSGDGSISDAASSDTKTSEPQNSKTMPATGEGQACSITEMLAIAMRQNPAGRCCQCGLIGDLMILTPIGLTCGPCTHRYFAYKGSRCG